jgi:hypothetical protein
MSTAAPALPLPPRPPGPPGPAPAPQAPPPPTSTPPPAPPTATPPAGSRDEAEAEDARPSPWRRRPSTPLMLRVGMALAVLPVAFFAVAIQLASDRNESTLETVGRDATSGITVAQAIKLNIAELDAIVVQRLLEPTELGSAGFPADYNEKREELHDNLVAAASESSTGAAYRQPLINIDYALAHYHTLARDAFAANRDGDTAQAAQLYAQAHEVADGTLLAEADFVDKANTYVLNDTYDAQTARAASTNRLIVIASVVLVAFLVVVQLLMARKFRRMVNVSLLAATVLAAGCGAFALARLDSSAGSLTEAREQAFDSVHVLARARATVVSARQAQGQLLLAPSSAPQALESFNEQAERVFRVQDGDAAQLALAGEVPPGAGGYLARTVATGADASQEASREALVAFGEFLEADADLREQVSSGDLAGARATYERGEAYSMVTGAIDDARDSDQDLFDDHVADANRTASGVGPLALGAAVGVLLLVVGGLYLRLREYRT